MRKITAIDEVRKNLPASHETLSTGIGANKYPSKSPQSMNVQTGPNISTGTDWFGKSVPQTGPVRGQRSGHPCLTDSLSQS